MKKVFISMPMKGKNNTEIKQNVNNLFQKFLSVEGDDEKYELLDTVFNFPGKGGLYYLGKSLIVMHDADVIVFGKGYEAAQGCVIEHMCAEKYNVDTILYETEEGISKNKEINTGDGSILDNI